RPPAADPLGGFSVGALPPHDHPRPVGDDCLRTLRSVAPEAAAMAPAMGTSSRGSRRFHAGDDRSALRELGFDQRGIEHGNYRVKHNAVLVVTSLLSILLLTLHITDDIVRGISKAEPSNIALLVLAV